MSAADSRPPTAPVAVTGPLRARREATTGLGMPRRHGSRSGHRRLIDAPANPRWWHEAVRLDRFADPAYARLRAELRGRLRDWMVETADPLALWAQRIL